MLNRKAILNRTRIVEKAYRILKDCPRGCYHPHTQQLYIRHPKRQSIKILVSYKS